MVYLSAQGSQKLKEPLFVLEAKKSKSDSFHAVYQLLKSKIKCLL